MQQLLGSLGEVQYGRNRMEVRTDRCDHVRRPAEDGEGNEFCVWSHLENIVADERHIDQICPKVPLDKDACLVASKGVVYAMEDAVGLPAQETLSE